MPTYLFEDEEGQVIERMFPMSEIPQEIKEDGKVFKYKPSFSTNFIYRGYGWANKGHTGISPIHQKEVGIRVDHDLKRQMQEAGEI